MTLESDSFPFDPLKAQTLIITTLTEHFLTSDGDVRSTSVIGYSRPNHGRIGTPFVNKDIWSRDYTFSVRSDVGELDKLDTAVQRSSTDKRDMAPLRIEEGIPKSIFPEIVEEFNSSERIKFTATPSRIS